jgi:hypothetical protein
VVAVDDRDVSWPDEPEPVPPPGWTREGMGPRSA